MAGGAVTSIELACVVRASPATALLGASRLAGSGVVGRKPKVSEPCAWRTSSASAAVALIKAIASVAIAALVVAVSVRVSERLQLAPAWLRLLPEIPFVVGRPPMASV